MRLEEVYLRIAVDQDEDNDGEENEDAIEDDCSKVFNADLSFSASEFYLSQYEGLFIKSFRVAYRTSLLFLFICLLALCVRLLIDRKSDDGGIEFHLDDWKHLNEQNVFLGLIEGEQDEKGLDHMTKLIGERSPSTKLIRQTNISEMIQFDQLFLGIYPFSRRKCLIRSITE